MGKTERVPLKLWRADTELLIPVLVDCPDGGHPARDAEGNRIFVNTHFMTEDEAWQRLFDEVSASCRLINQRLIEIEQNLFEYRGVAEKLSNQYQWLRNNHAKWQQRKSQEETEGDEIMTWKEYHGKSENFAAQAETHARDQASHMAEKFYGKAAEYEAIALMHLNPFDPNIARTFNVTVVSVVALFKKARKNESAVRIAQTWLASGVLLPYAQDELNQMLQELLQATSEPSLLGSSK